MTSFTPSQAANAMSVPQVQCVLVEAGGVEWANYWCPTHRQWHCHGWRNADPGFRVGCCGQIQLVPVGKANSELRKRIRNDGAPVGAYDPGPILYPQRAKDDTSARLRALRTYLATPGSLTELSVTWLERIVRQLLVWRYIHEMTGGAPRANDIAKIVDLAEQGLSIEEATKEIIPYWAPVAARSETYPAPATIGPWKPRAVPLSGVIVTEEATKTALPSNQSPNVHWKHRDSDTIQRG
jgi:hypothetical protein